MNLVPAGTLLRVAILVFDGLQIIDFAGPYEVFGQAHFEVFTVAEQVRPLTTAMGLRITPSFDFAGAPPADVLLVPGGDVEPSLANAKLLDWVRQASGRARVTLSVCNGAFILAEAGLLDGLSATTFAALIDELRSAAPRTQVVADRRFVDNGTVVTSAGLSSGIDAALHVVEKLLGRGRAQQVATGLEYNWDPESKYVRAQLADRHLVSLSRLIGDSEAALQSYQGGTDTWENRWRIENAATASAALERLRAAARGLSGWRPVDDSADPNRGAWSFKDEYGSGWTAVASVEPTGESTDQFFVTLRVQRQ
jgi:putative intracellular protease/amidase